MLTTPPSLPALRIYWIPASSASEEPFGICSAATWASKRVTAGNAHAPAGSECNGACRCSDILAYAAHPFMSNIMYGTACCIQHQDAWCGPPGDPTARGAHKAMRVCGANNRNSCRCIICPGWPWAGEVLELGKCPWHLRPSADLVTAWTFAPTSWYVVPLSAQCIHESGELSQSICIISPWLSTEGAGGLAEDARVAVVGEVSQPC